MAKEKPVEKITVDEITSKAGVGRASYFRYFNSKEEIITFKMDALWKSWSKEHEILNQEKYTMEKGIIFYRLNYSIKDILRLIYSIGMKSVIFNAFNDVIVNPYSNDDYKFYNKQFFSSGLFGILDAWIRNDFKESPELIAEYTNRILYE